MTSGLLAVLAGIGLGVNARGLARRYYGSAELGGATVGGDFAIGNGPCNGLISTGPGGTGLSYDLSPFVFAGGEVHSGVTDTLTNTVASFNLYDLWDKITSFLP